MKLDGVVKVDIEPGEKPETQRVSVFSSSQGLTKEAAVKSLGDKAETYVVHTFGKEGETLSDKKDS